MTTLPLPLQFTTRASVLLAAVVVALALAGKASAGCGDHVVILKPAGQAKADGKSPEPSVPKPPCHGPNCSATPSPPAAPASPSGAVIRVSAKDLFTPVGPLGESESPAVRRAFEFTSPSPIDRAPSIFHPPRA